MDEFLLKINEKFNNENFEDWNIQDLFWNFEKINTPISTIFEKYLFTKSKQFIVNEEEIRIILDNYSNEYNILVKSTLDYLISNSKYYNESNLQKDAIDLIHMYFDKNNGLPIYNLSTVIKWTIK